MNAMIRTGNRLRYISNIGVVLLICVVFIFTSLPDNLETQETPPRVPTRVTPSEARLDDCRNCFLNNYPRLIDPKDVCGGSRDILLLILITTVPSEIVERHALRQTWLPPNRGPVRHVFIFGATKSAADQLLLDDENQVHGDILQDNYVDSYFNLSVKVIVGMQWVTDNCPRARYVVRTACDNYVHVPQLVALLTAPPAQLHNAWFGWCIEIPFVLREPGKWFVSRVEYPKDLYPSYCVGTTFVMPYRVMGKVLLASRNTPFFAMEDCYFGMCAEKTDVNVVHVDGFNHERCKGLFRAGDCLSDPLIFSLHQVTSEAQYIVHRFLSTRDVIMGQNLTSLVKLTLFSKSHNTATVSSRAS